MVRGLTVFSVLFLGTLPIFLLLLFFGLPTLLLPEALRVALRAPQLFCGRLWIGFSTSVLKLAGVIDVQAEGHTGLAANGRYLLLCNHRSWTDIMVLLLLFGPRMPFPRFLAKRQMLWIPFIGVAIWLLDFPLLRRGTPGDSAARAARDREAVARGCRRLGSSPFTLVIFPEGTRYRAEKHQRLESPYAGLLPPRAGGISVALEHLGEHLDAVVDVTLGYAREGATYWDALCGRGGRVRAHVALRPVPLALLGLDGEARRTALQEWLYGVWREKEQQLATWHQEATRL